MLSDRIKTSPHTPKIIWGATILMFAMCAASIYVLVAFTPEQIIATSNEILGFTGPENVIVTENLQITESITVTKNGQP